MTNIKTLPRHFSSYIILSNFNCIIISHQNQHSITDKCFTPFDKKNIQKKESANGEKISSGPSTVNDDISTVNGKISLENTKLDGDIKTNNGDIEIFDESEVKGDIIIRKSTGNGNKTLSIKITEGSKVKGNIIVKDNDLRVKVLISDGSEVTGKIVNAELIK